jgi:hypothetical protein
MTCKSCNGIQDQDVSGGAYYYRIEEANVAVIGCEKHVTEMFRRLREWDVTAGKVEKVLRDD